MMSAAHDDSGLRAKLWGRYEHRKNVPLDGLLVDGRPALTGLDPALVGDYVIVTVRDPLCAYDTDPAELIAQRLNDPVVAGRTGMFSLWSGTFEGAAITVVSGGSGAPEAELAMHELLQFTNAGTFLRIGGSGGMHPSVRPGDLVIAHGVVRDEGMTAAYVPPSWPAVCSPELVLALAAAASELGARYHVGLTRSTDSDFVAGGRPGVGGYFQPWHLDVVDSWSRAGVLNGDRESSAIVTLATLFGRRAGSICSVADNISTGEAFRAGAGHEHAIEVGLRGLALLHKMDEERDRQGFQLWNPATSRPASSISEGFRHS
jgi:uridine phosphorylase